MQENELFEYAVIRLVPKVAREEFVNIGVVLYCRGHRFLAMRYVLDEDRLRLFGGGIDVEELHAYLNAFRLICNGKPEGGVIAELPIAERFRWLTAKRSTVIQTSAVHPGMCVVPQQTLERLFDELVI